jgi:short-subunit dehydrogenase
MGLALDGARVLLTGASAGIGAATAPVLAARGATVAVTARRVDRLEAVVAAMPGAGHVSLPADLAAPGATDALLAAAAEAIGPLDVVVHNAAIPKRRAVTALTEAEVDEVLDLNLRVPVRMTLSSLPGMLARGRGCHVYVSSLAGRLGVAHEAAYCASKFALAGWAEAMAVDLWDTPVEVRLVLPGAIDTEIWDQAGNDPPLYHGPFEPPSTVAEAIADAIEGDEFEVYSPDLRSVVAFRTGEPDTFLAGVAAMAREGDRAGDGP